MFPTFLLFIYNLLLRNNINIPVNPCYTIKHHKKLNQLIHTQQNTKRFQVAMKFAKTCKEILGINKRILSQKPLAVRLKTQNTLIHRAYITHFKIKMLLMDHQIKFVIRPNRSNL